MKYIIREVAPENCDFAYYFDDDGLTEKSGDYNNNLFIVCNAGYNRLSGFNIDEYKNIQAKAENILDGFSDIEDGLTDYDGKRYTYKDIMIENDIQYTSTTCHKLKKWAKSADIYNTDDIAAFLSIITREEWHVVDVYGYCQGDYCEVVSCKGRYNNSAQYGEIYLGCGKEFSVITIDENREKECVYGYIVADCEVKNDEDYKHLVSEWACIPIEDTTLELIENTFVQTCHTYRTI